MKGLPTTIRLLDPPLHEFLPNLEELLVGDSCYERKGRVRPKVAAKAFLLKKVKSLAEFNPMLGLQGLPPGASLPRDICCPSEGNLQAAARL